MTNTIVDCRRCGGTGRYAYNLRDGDRCYGCSGSGKQAVDLVAEKRAAERKAKAAAKREAARLARFAAAEAERDRLVAELVERFPAEGARLLAALDAEDFRGNEVRVGLCSFSHNGSITVEQAAAFIARWENLGN